MQITEEQLKEWEEATSQIQDSLVIGDEFAKDFVKLIQAYREQQEKIKRYENRIEELEIHILWLKTLGMENSPCGVCGYNGPGYYQPEKHACAEIYHSLRKQIEEQQKKFERLNNYIQGCLV